MSDDIMIQTWLNDPLMSTPMMSRPTAHRQKERERLSQIVLAHIRRASLGDGSSQCTDVNSLPIEQAEDRLMDRIR